MVRRSAPFGTPFLRIESTSAPSAPAWVAEVPLPYRSWPRRLPASRSGQVARASDPLFQEHSLSLSLCKDREQSEDQDIEAERGDRGMAEHLLDPEETQDWSENQDDDQRGHRVSDERREKDATDHQLGKGMHHAACSTLGATRRSRIAAVWSKYDRALPRMVGCCGLPRVAPASWAIRSASRNIASSGAHRRSRPESIWSSSRRADASSQPSRVSPDGGGMRSCPASSRPIPATKNKTLNRKMFGS